MVVKDKKFSLKSVLALLAIVCILTAGVSYVAWSGTSFTAPDIYLEGLPATATYTIDTDGTNYWAIKSNGDITFDSTNASYTINSAISALTSGGKIFVKAGTYTLEQPLTVTGKTGISIEGEGYSTEIRCSSADYIIKVRNAGRVKISDLALVLWYAANLGGLEVYNTFSSDFDNINILGISSSDARIGVLIDKDDTDPSFEAAYWNMFSNFIIRTFGTEVKITGGANAQNFIQSEFLGFADGINIDDGDAVVISHSYFESFSGTGILINDNWARTLGNRFETSTVGAIGINVTSGSTNSHLVGDIFYIPNGIRISDNGSDTILDEAWHKNSGTVTNKANGGTIAHGLAGTPTTVTLTSLNATYDGVGVVVAWDIDNTSSTNISLDIYWINGTAITDSVIDVSWSAVYKP